MPTLPSDFAVSYHWREGSLPPPYHYQYDIEIDAQGNGTITMIPDYPSDETPVWTREFSVPAAEMDRLYELLLELRFFETTWRGDEFPPVGGSSQTLTVTAAGRQVTVPAFPVAGQQEAARAANAAITALVPEETWTELNAMREEYVLERME